MGRGDLYRVLPIGSPVTKEGLRDYGTSLHSYWDIDAIKYCYEAVQQHRQYGKQTGETVCTDASTRAERSSEHHALQVMIIFERLAESKHHPCLQIWQEGGTRELLACQYYLYPWKGDAAPLSGGLRYQHG